MSFSLICQARCVTLRPLIRAIAGFTLLVLGCFCGGSANAEILLFSANSGEQSFTGTSFVDLNGAITNNAVRASVVASARPPVAGTHAVRVRVRMVSLADDTSLRATLQAMPLTVLR